MDVTLLGMTTLVRALLGMTTLVRALHPRKAKLPMDVTLLGILTSIRRARSCKVLASSLVRPCGMINIVLVFDAMVIGGL